MGGWIINVYLFSMLFMSCIFTPSNGGKEIFINKPVKGHDTDFDQFMKGMFSEMPPAKTAINQEMKGPNAGYRPYWFGYHFADGPLPWQKDTGVYIMKSSHEEWDYGLGQGSGKGIWGGGNLSLMAAAGDIGVGVGGLIDKDAISAGDDFGGKDKLTCYPNLGKTCVLGLPPEAATDEVMATWQKKTWECDKCSQEDKQVGLVCAVDKTGTVFQETDMCVMTKMNCLGGNAYVYSNTLGGWDYLGKYGAFNYPFLVQPGWARVSLKGEVDAEIRLYSDIPWQKPRSVNKYWLIMAGWPRTLGGPWSEIYVDCPVPYDYYYCVFSQPVKRGAALNGYTYTEYTIVWNSQNGWFLMSQARFEDWADRFHMEYTDPQPRNFKYIDVSTGYNNWPIHFILHELSVLHTGPCMFEGPKDVFPSDTEGIHKRAHNVEAAYQKRLREVRNKGIRPEYWDREEGSYIEY